MRDIKELNNALNNPDVCDCAGPCDGTCLENDCIPGGDWENCGNAVICVFPGQYYSDLPSHGEVVFHHNLGIDVVNTNIVDISDEIQGDLDSFCNACNDMMSGDCDGADPENCGSHPCYQDDDPPTLPNAGDDQTFILIGHDRQNLEVRKQHLENTWADVAKRCTYKTDNPWNGSCALNFGDPCLFDKCKRI